MRKGIVKANSANCLTLIIYVTFAMGFWAASEKPEVPQPKKNDKQYSRNMRVIKLKQSKINFTVAESQEVNI